ncbi:MAG: nucleotide-binding protein [Methanospirillaceae archaeon]|nr:nucleotide-binding protein [Methanospirillaceae archaeon]
MSRSDLHDESMYQMNSSTIYVLDTSFFLYSLPLSGILYTTPEICSELRDLRGRARLETLLAGGLSVYTPSPAGYEKVKQAARESGDRKVLSPADKSLLACATDLSGTVVSDDFALQNVAHHLGLSVLPIMQRQAKERRWEYVCTGCGATGIVGDDCPVCGSACLRRRVK